MSAFIYDTRCLECGVEYPLESRSVRFGPLDDQVVIGEEEVDEITQLVTEPLYKGNVTKISCPICTLSIIFPTDLAPWSLAYYFENAAEFFDGLEMHRVFESSPVRCRFRGFPVQCPRCDGQIDADSLHKRCRECGSTQLQVLRSRRESTDTRAEQGGAGQPATAVESKAE